jgi:uncharacterized membrane protein YadS
MVPLAFLIAVWYTRNVLTNRKSHDRHINIAKAFPWFLFGYFIMAGLNTLGYFTPEGVKAFNSAGRFLILVGLAGIGLNTVFSSFKTVGVKPLIVGLIGALVVAGCSILLIMFLL